MKIKVTQILNETVVSSIEINLPDDLEYIKEIHKCFQNNFPNCQINFYWRNNFLLGQCQYDLISIRRNRLKAYIHKLKVAV